MVACVLAIVGGASVHAQNTMPARTYIDFDFDWGFSKTDSGNAMMPAFDDSSWRKLNVPHDWSIEGPFGPEYGSGNGFAPGGVAWYRKHFTLDAAHQGKLVTVEFDGVYDHSQVYINGFVVGGRAYGYSSFECDLTPYMKFGPDDNVLAVRVDHSKYADSRWYTGSGIYRSVRLRVTDKRHIAQNGLYVTTPDVNGASATVRVEIAIENLGAPTALLVESQVLAADGRTIGSASSNVPDANAPIIQQINIDRPQLWSIESPLLYTLRTRVMQNMKVLDEVSTPFGIRTIRFDANKGFFLNGKSMKLKGVCIHHDAGAIGAAVPVRVLERRLKLLKELGVNAIRTSHNPPAPELLDLCDRMGLLVKDEAFDEFTPAKNKWVVGWNQGQPGRWGYADLFDQWAITDVQDMVRRDRNHPSVIMWSIGNEIDYANDPFTHPVLGNQYRPGNPRAEELVRLGKPLVDAVKKLDPTRPVTAALANITMSNAVGLPEILDVVGYNYQEANYAADHAKYPNRVIFGSENNDTYANWLAVRDNDYISGQFLWTGIDYLGEARAWPSRGNTAGILDTCGFKKPDAWFRQSLWSDKPMVYLCTSSGGGRGRGGRGGGGGGLNESWTYTAGASVNVTCYSNCEQVQLTLNDKPIGVKRLAEAVNGVLTFTVPFEPGVLKAVGLNSDKPASECVLRTAGPAARIELVPDQMQLRADGKDVCHLEFRITDDKGVLVLNAQDEVKFEFTGPVQLLGIDNGGMTGPEDYRSPQRKASRGRGLAILQSTTMAGKITVNVNGAGLQPATLDLTSR
jgi:beta-galactosidase